MLNAEDEDFTTIEDYLSAELLSETKHEYLGGIVHPRPYGTLNHSGVATNLIGCLGNELFGKTCYAFGSDFKIRIQLPRQTRFYYPDCSIACIQIDGGSHFFDNPTLVAEVLSPSTRRVDLGEKLEAYLTIPSLKIVLLLEPDFPHITLHRRNPNGGFTIEVYKSLDDLIPLPEIEAELSVARLYDRITPPSA